MARYNTKPLSADEEKALARAIIAAEQRALELVGDLEVSRPFLTGRKKRSERTRAGDVDRLGKAIDAVWEASKTDADLRPVARDARKAWAEAEHLRWRLAMSGKRIAHGEARKLRGTYMDEADLVQEGFVGLLRAAKRFDPDRNIRFSTYARWWVRAQMTRAIDHTGRMVRLPGCAVEQTRNLRKAMRAFERLGDDYTVEDLANEVGIEKERAEFLLSRGKTVSLDEPVDDGPKARPVGHFLADEEADDPQVEAEHSQEVHRMMQALNEVLDDRHRHVITKRFGLEDNTFRSLSEIARGMDLSRERVRQLEREALQCLRQMGDIRDLHQAA